MCEPEAAEKEGAADWAAPAHELIDVNPPRPRFRSFLQRQFQDAIFQLSGDLLLVDLA